ncbi:MAG TPA: TlpA disulfide reductase family protein [Gemmatimonadaceae bacterium]|nr:TlpA disulfide reductase family protein [Gemmatimonadaceae bacterium]
MTVRQQWTLVLGVVAVLALALWTATHFLRDELFPVTIGSEAPDFTARTLGTPATTKTLDDYRGEVVLLNVWATWCAPCREEMPSIEALHRRYGPRGLKVVAVSIDEPGSEDAIRDFARQFGLSFEILHDASGDIQRIYQTTGVPETFVIGRDGIIRRKQIGATDWSSPANRAVIARLLGVPGDTAAIPGGDTARTVPAMAPASGVGATPAPGAR